MEQASSAGFPWKEETITDLLLAEVATRIRVVPFTHTQETQVGADWLWWWIDGSGEAFGMLAQAKRLRINTRRWKFDFQYPNGSGTQQDRLLRSGQRLGVPSTYALYLGTQDFRSPSSCGTTHKNLKCNTYRRRTVSVMPALLADSSLVLDAPSTYARSVALEDLARRQRLDRTAMQHVHQSLRRTLPPALRAYFTAPQSGARRVARELLDRILEVRHGQFAAALAEQKNYESIGPVFESLPLDQGHFEEPYFPHVLRGLRSSVPAYVLDAEHAQEPIDSPAEISDVESGVAGIVVVRLG